MSARPRAPGSATMGAWLAPSAVWLASAAPFFVAEERLAGVSRAALAALPWIAWSALPRKVNASDTAAEAAPWLAIPLELVLMLPPLCLGAWIDLAAGMPPARTAGVAITGAVLVTVLAAGARLAARSKVALRRHAIAWIVLVAGIPLLAAALHLGGSPVFGPAPAWMAWLARASPIAWGIEVLSATEPPPELAWAPFLVALSLIAIAAPGALEPGARSEVRA